MNDFTMYRKAMTEQDNQNKMVSSLPVPHKHRAILDALGGDMTLFRACLKSSDINDFIYKHKPTYNSKQWGFFLAALTPSEAMDLPTFLARCTRYADTYKFGMTCDETAGGVEVIFQEGNTAMWQGTYDLEGYFAWRYDPTI